MADFSGRNQRPAAARFQRHPPTWAPTMLIARRQASTAKRCHDPGTPLSRCSPRSTNGIPDPTTKSTTVRDTRISERSAKAATPRADVDGDPTDVVPNANDFTGVQPCPNVDSEGVKFVANGQPALDSPGRTVEERKKSGLRFAGQEREDQIALLAPALRPEAKVILSGQLDPAGTGNRRREGTA